MAKLLKEYNKKRDFSKTREPSGASRTKKSKEPIFVIQEHHATRLHYDFRLELEGVLKSWAVPKGPSQDPKDKRLAVQTEDHPLSYATFHGTIPKGEYGGGDVFIWDKGTWRCEDPDPVEALKKGRLEFSLKGKRLHGKWMLVRTHYKETETKKNWLLIKKTDEKKISSNVQDKWPGFVAPQLPKLVEETPVNEKDWIHELKYDGYRVQAHFKDGLSHLWTRNELDYTRKFPHINNEVERLKVTDAILDGEVVALDKEGKTDFQLLQNSLSERDDKYLRYYVFDILYLNGEDLRSRPLLERKKILRDLIPKKNHYLFYSDHFENQGRKLFEASCGHGLEGIVSKLRDSNYRSGRSDLWVKTKCSSRQEFVIGGWSEPKGGRLGIGALLVGYYEDEKFIYAGKVGTGFTQKSLLEIQRTLKKLEQDESPFDERSPRGKDIHWVKPEKVCEVSFANWTAEKSLRAPVFHGLRVDKPSKSISKEKPALSNPDKVIFKDEKITKSMIANFYQKISKYMLPYVKNRPLSLVRCPEGGSGKCFFQKHVHGKIPATFQTFKMKEKSGEGEYISIDSVEGLVELVQLNSYEIHAWNCHTDHDYLPDQFVMDFDPGEEVSWKTTVSSAFELKKILEDLGLKSFVKISGGKGVHVHVPIAPIYSWDDVKSFTHTLALEMVDRHPDLFVANMSKKIRRNKIFLDYLRNGYGATAVVPYSLRAKTYSSVALPVTWEELKGIKAPDEISLQKALRKISSRKKDPWAGFLKLKQKIEILNKSS